MDSNYLKWYFSSPTFRNLLVSQVAGIGGSLTRAQPKQVAKYPVPIVDICEQRRIAAIRIRLNDVLVADLSDLARQTPETIIHISVELGHAIGNQHWPAVVKGTKVYIPLTVDKKVMDSVMRTHHIEGVAYSFQPGSEVIPYLAPHEIRRLFGGTGPDSDVHHHHEHVHAH